MKKLLLLTIALVLLISFTVNVAAEESVISNGSSYSLITTPSASYADDGKKLTDGVFGTIPDGGTGYYSSNAYIGFTDENVDADGNIVIILDLGKEYTNITKMGIGYLNETSVGIYAPKTVRFEISNDRADGYSEAGTLTTAKETESGLSQTYADTVETSKLSGRYVRITITPLAEFTNADGNPERAEWTFIDEITVFADEDTSEAESSDPESEPENEKPQTGDDLEVFAFVLLALSSLAMLVALFVRSRNNEY